MKLVNGNVTATPEEYVEFMNGFCAGGILDNGLFNVAEVREAHVLNSLVRVVTFDSAIKLVGADFESFPVREIVTVAPHPDTSSVGRLGLLQAPDWECGDKSIGCCYVGDFLETWREGRNVPVDEIPVTDVVPIEVCGRQIWDLKLKFPLRLFDSGDLIRTIDRVKVVIDDDAYDYGDEQNDYVKRYFRPYVPFGLDDQCVFKPVGDKLISDELWYGQAGFADLYASYLEDYPARSRNGQFVYKTYGHPTAKVLADFLVGQYYPSHS